MNTNKFLIGGFVGGVIFFILGWLIYGMLLTEFFANNAGTATGISRTEPVLWALAIGNLAMGFLLSYILTRTGVYSAAGGFAVGAIVGLLLSIAIDFIMYGTTNFSTLTGIMVDIIVFTIMSGITGAAIGAVIGRGRYAAGGGSGNPRPI